MPTALALSPHLDDAVFSAGGTLARLSRAGWRVVIATVFTRSMPDPQGFALACQLDKGLAADVDYMALRRDEDAAACALLGAEPRWLPYPEAPHRGYGSAPALFGGLRAGDAIAAEIAPTLRDLIAELRPALVLAPQAVGAHVDHEALVLALDQVEVGVPLAWWCDYPYAIRGDYPREPFAARFTALQPMEVALTVHDRAAKTAAALAYASQLGFQFGGGDGLRRGLAAQAAERFRTTAALPLPPP